jgi:hypothetical protein
MKNFISRRKFIKFFVAGSLCTFTSPSLAWATNLDEKDLNILPMPKEIFYKNRAYAAFENPVSIMYSKGEEYLLSQLCSLLNIGSVSLTPPSSHEKLNLIIRYGHSSSYKIAVESYESLYSKIYGKTQGYFIDVNEDYLFIGAHDDEGMSNGLYTLLEIITKTANEVKLPLVTIIDYPDFILRSPTYMYTLQAALTKDGGYNNKVKAYLDFLASKKVNASFWPRVTITGDLKMNEDWHYDDINQHALNRGIKLFVESHFNLSVAWRNEGVTNSRICMGSEALSGFCYGDDMIEKKSKKLREFCSKYKPGGIFFHTIDFDPHLWKGKTGWWDQRCEVCRKKYKDDERWKADRDQINAFYKTVKSVSPNTEIMIVLWPYHPRMLTGGWNLFPGSENKYKDYLLKVTSEIPKDIWLATRECSPSELDVWLKHINNQPIAWCIYPGRRNHWIYTSMASMATWFKDNYKMAMFWSDSGIWFPFELSNMTAQQFIWNTKTEGYQIYQSINAMYDKWRNDNIAYKPEKIVNDLMPRIAQNIYGDSGQHVLKALKTNVERNDPSLPYDTGESGWHYSRFEYDIDGKEPSSMDNKIHDPAKTFTTIRDEAAEMHSAMTEALDHLPQDEVRKFIIISLYEKSRQLKARGEGFYNWMIASQSIKNNNSDNEKTVENIIKSIAYFESEMVFMDNAEKNGYPPEVTQMFGYVPIYWKPLEKLHKWCAKNGFTIPEREKINAFRKQIVF